MLSLVLVMVLVAAVGYIATLSRSVSKLESTLTWQRAEGQAWMHKVACPVIEPAIAVSKLLDSLWTHLLAARIKNTILTVLRSALAEIPARWRIQITEFDVGDQAPVINQVTSILGQDGKLQALDCDACFDHTLMLVLKASTPIGTGTMKVCPERIGCVVAAGTLALTHPSLQIAAPQIAVCLPFQSHQADEARFCSIRAFASNTQVCCAYLLL